MLTVDVVGSSVVEVVDVGRIKAGESGMDWAFRSSTIPNGTVDPFSFNDWSIFGSSSVSLEMLAPSGALEPSFFEESFDTFTGDVLI